MPPMASLATPLAQPTLKFSKLATKVRQLGCETFSRNVVTVAANNWLERVLDTLTDMDLDDELKLRMATRLLDKSATISWDNLKLHSTTLVTWNYFMCEFNE